VAGVTITPATFSFGEHASQSADLYVPADEGLHPVVVLIHGGYWRTPFARELMAPLAEDLVSRGFAVWNIDYRRVGDGGGGEAWRVTFDDVVAALELLSEIGAEHGADVDRIALAGHSAGGHLALWLASEFEVDAVVSLAGVANLYDSVQARGGLGSAKEGLGVLDTPAAVELLGGTPKEVPDRYAYASPSALLPLGAPILVLHGDLDDRLPVRHAEDFATLARDAGDAVELAVLRGVGHFELIDPKHESWARAVDFIDRHIGELPDEDA
jgi:acetyl esterase/lipase